MYNEIDNLFQKGNINEIGWARCIWLMLYNNYVDTFFLPIEETSDAEIIYLKQYGCRVQYESDILYKVTLK